MNFYITLSLYITRQAREAGVAYLPDESSIQLTQKLKKKKFLVLKNVGNVEKNYSQS